MRLPWEPPWNRSRSKVTLRSDEYRKETPLKRRAECCISLVLCVFIVMAFVDDGKNHQSCLENLPPSCFLVTKKDLRGVGWVLSFWYVCVCKRWWRKFICDNDHLSVCALECALRRKQETGRAKNEFCVWAAKRTAARRFVVCGVETISWGVIHFFLFGRTFHRCAHQFTMMWICVHWEVRQKWNVSSSACCLLPSSVSNVFFSEIGTIRTTMK